MADEYDEDGWESAWLECPRCGEEIIPGSRDATRCVAGEATLRINGEVADEATFRRELAGCISIDRARRDEAWGLSPATSG